jgi:hypothetical protein
VKIEENSHSPTDIERLPKNATCVSSCCGVMFASKSAIWFLRLLEHLDQLFQQDNIAIRRGNRLRVTYVAGALIKSLGLLNSQ